ncbi:hypothetical protein A374_03264 [Fictibacillus macauensis ZFHKF-1]|uniref:CAAX prenyl protease 2/Lysostaphin resistance protein A-like domain-containing protein n=1 Tax=Fictibacillus macauensis ZFHKF-1 TaxID=1196324 RepID=I8AL25_9BACL|nr:CPBP family intramembrane glutamic endopeptidase [Fictibacillus macauensis]EIT86557.1 hypothetical protein A374_03264 [Fictibacillus macauensis ZFHKF-1]
MSKKNQAALIQQLSDTELYLNIYLSQLLFLVAGSILMFFTSFPWSHVTWNTKAELYGLGLAIGTVLFNLLLYKWLPLSYVDDGGINERIFSSLSLPNIALLTLVIAICEEWLFRGALQNLLGLHITSICFALLHIRYLKKPVLFSVAVLLSYLLGYLYESTDNLVAPMSAHFLIDFLLGALLAKRGSSRAIKEMVTRSKRE